MNRYGVLHEIPAERVLDVVIAEALGWKWEAFKRAHGDDPLCTLQPPYTWTPETGGWMGISRSFNPGVVTREEALAIGIYADWDEACWFYPPGPNANATMRGLPHFASRQGFWLLIDELKARDLNFCVGAGVGNDPAYARVGPPDWVTQSTKHTHGAFGETQYGVETALARAFLAAITEHNNEANRSSENGPNDPT